MEQEAYRKAMEWVYEAGEIIKERMKQTPDIQVKSSHADLVTEVDREVEAYIVNQIQKHYPLHNILGEEDIGNVMSDSPFLWIIDPIDGTSNFINRKKDFAISVAFCCNDQGVFGIIYDVAADKLYRAMKGDGAFVNDSRLASIDHRSALEHELVAVNIPWDGIDEIKRWPQLYHLASNARGVRVYGATTIELCDIAEGRLGGFAQYFVHAWDFAAGRVILEEIGGKFSDLQGNEIGMIYSGGVVAGSTYLHKQMVDLLKASTHLEN